MIMQHEGKVWLQQLRLAALIALYKAPARRMNESTLHSVLVDQEHFAVARRVLVAELSGLAEAGLIWLDEASHSAVATLTSIGVDVVLGRDAHPLVTVPSPETQRRLSAHGALTAAAMIARDTLEG